MRGAGISRPKIGSRSIIRKPERMKGYKVAVAKDISIASPRKSGGVRGFLPPPLVDKVTSVK